MFHVITGGSGSGKSAYAEDCMMKYHEAMDRPLFYIATMMPFGAEMEAKIQRHRMMRAGKGFETKECYVNLKDQVREADVLLECMSNLTANEWFAAVETVDLTDANACNAAAEAVIEKIWSGLKLLLSSNANVIVVTNEVCAEGEQNTIEMECYKQILSGVNCRMAAAADRVTEVVYGIPVQLKEV